MPTTDPNLPIPTYPTGEPTSVLNFSDLITEVAYKIGCAYYGSDGQGAPQPPIDMHDLTICQRIVNKGIRKFIADAPKGGWSWTNPIAQVDLFPQISYDPTGQTYVTLEYQTSGTYADCTILTLVTPPFPPIIGDTAWVPQFMQSMEMRQIYLNGNPPTNTPGWWFPVDEQFTGNLIGNPYTVLFYLSPTQIVLDGNATLPIVNFSPGTVGNPLGGNPIPSQGPQNGQMYMLIKGATSGTFTVSVTTPLGTDTTASIEWNASATAIQSAFTALSNVGSGGCNVQATGAAGQFLITWNPSLFNVTCVLDANDLSGSITATPFSFACTGDYTLPANFGGEYTGNITYVANTNRGMILRWVDEFSIRSRRQNYNIESGTPYEAAVRVMPTPSYANLTDASGLMTPRRRWELMTWRISSEFLSVIFPYTLSFNALVNMTDLPPTPFSQDEALKACCLAVAEKETDDTITGTDWQYYHQVALQQAYDINARMFPKAIGYFGNPTAAGSVVPPIKAFRDYWYQRPTVPVFGGGPGQG
jgi:hypothetical protein